VGTSKPQIHTQVFIWHFRWCSKHFRQCMQLLTSMLVLWNGKLI